MRARGGMVSRTRRMRSYRMQWNERKRWTMCKQRHLYEWVSRRKRAREVEGWGAVLKHETAVIVEVIQTCMGWRRREKEDEKTERKATRKIVESFMELFLHRCGRRGEQSRVPAARTGTLASTWGFGWEPETEIRFGSGRNKLHLMPFVAGSECLALWSTGGE